MKHSIKIKADVDFTDNQTSSGKALERSDSLSVYSGFRLARVGISISDPTKNIIGVVNKAGTGYVADGLHPDVCVLSGETFDAGATLYLKNQIVGSALTSVPPEYNGQTIWPIAIALEGSDSKHYQDTQRVQALIRVGTPTIQTEGEDP